MSKDIRSRIERRFEDFTRLIYRHRFKTLIMLLLVVAPLLAQLPKITIDTSTEGFMHPDDPALIDYNAFRDQFGRDEVAIIAIKPPEVFDREFLEKLKAFHNDLEANVPHVNEITSLVNARNTYGKEDELVVEDLLEDWPETAEAVAALRERVLSNPIYKNFLISEDGTFTTVVIRTNTYSSEGESMEDVLGGFGDTEITPVETQPRAYLTDAENSELVHAIHEVMKRHLATDFPLTAAGSPVVTDALKRMMMQDMQRFIKLSLLTIAVFLFLMFRRISGVFMPLLIVILTLLSTVALMAATGGAIKLPTQVLPSFLLAVCVGASVHVLAIFYLKLKETKDKESAIVYTMGHSGLAIVMTSLTTAGGLLSFATAEVAPIADLGRYASAGVMLSLLYTVVLLPVLISIFPVRPQARFADRSAANTFDRLFTWITRVTTEHAKGILVFSAIVMMVAIFGTTLIRFSHHPLTWLPKDNESRLSTELIDHELKGSISVEAIIDTGRENGLYEPRIMQGLSDAADKVESYQDDYIVVGNSISSADILKEINRALNENREAFYRIPSDQDLIAQELLLFENSGSDDLEDVVDSQFQKARFTAKVPFTDAIRYKPFIDSVGETFHGIFGKEANITVTGMLPLFARTIRNAMVSMAKSYIIAAVVITVMMVLFIGNLRFGLLSMVPNLTPIIATIGVMGLAGLPMDLFTMFIGSIAIGLAVDDTIHFMHNFRRYYAESGDTYDAIRRTLLGTGRAMLVTSCVLSIGFFIFMFAHMANLVRFGLLTGLAIVLALLSDYFLAPALLTLVTRYKPSKEI